MRVARCLLFAFLAALMIMLAFPCTSAAKIPLLVETLYGPVLGSISFSGTRVFKGIPYAAPPVGDLRWKAPIEPEPWKIPMLCDAFRSSCPSNPMTTDLDLHIETFDEDCLYLNVWTPAEDPGSLLPVMVFIHGGSFLTGSAAKRVYDGSYLAERGVVVVTINYRVGVFGFFCHSGLADEKTGGSYGNYGLLDQVAALKWVNGNISRFGGDPGRVTIFGESAGAVSVLTLMSSSLTKGLFNRAIAQSGAIPFGLKKPEEACSFWARQAKKVGIENFDSSLEELKAMDWEQLLKMNPSNDGDMPARSTLELLCIDGLLLRKQPIDVFRDSEQSRVPLIVGSNSDEMGLNSQEGTSTAEDYRKKLEKYFPGQSEEIMERYPFEEAKPGRSFNNAISDAVFTSSAKQTSILHLKAGNRTYLYTFGYASKLLKSLGVGAFHASELLYLFGSVDTPAFLLEERIMARIMADYWTSFSKDGVPKREGKADWPEASIANGAGMYLNGSPYAVDDMNAEAYDFWMTIVAGRTSLGGI